jgi:hypothetical protein
MQRHNKKKEQHSQQNSRSSRHFRVDGSDCRCDERDAAHVAEQVDRGLLHRAVGCRGRG